MSWVRIWVHLVFSTKNREPFLYSVDLRKQFFQHIKKNAEEKQIWLDCINGYAEHAHCLVSLGKDQPVSKVVQLIKGESSFWINNTKLIKDKFAWQDDYWAVGISESHLDKVRHYIHNQEKHHGSKTFSEELTEFMDKYGWKFVQHTRDT
ncbi:MAG: transposase [Bacteroidales bacterium]